MAFIAIFLRLSHPGFDRLEKLDVINWDAFGYYMYLPSVFIYHDIKDLNWLQEADRHYKLTGGDVYQAEQLDNGNYVFRYYYGVSALQSPFFLLSVFYANVFDYEVDGFSPPFQWAVAIAALTYFIFGLLLIRKVLLHFFDDRTVSITILLIALASNVLQYVSRDSGMSHVYSFFLFSLLMWFTHRWHVNRSLKLSFGIGVSLGFIAITRPTDAVAFLIPLLWAVESRKDLLSKWKQIKSNGDLGMTLVGVAIPVIPQIIYWWIATGSPIYNVGSRWVFFNPWWRVLFGFGNGWFIYTPVSILFVLGLFHLKKRPFKKAVIFFCLINVWIIISWIDYTYGATYSCRALVQSYSIFSLALASLVHHFSGVMMRLILIAGGVFLSWVNLFQLEQYHNTILHYRDMNFNYYSSIYLNNNPNPLDMSLLDSNEVFDFNFVNSKADTLIKYEENKVHQTENEEFLRLNLVSDGNYSEEDWIIIKSEIKVEGDFHHSFLNVVDKETEQKGRIRLFSPISAEGKWNNYEMHFQIIDQTKNDREIIFSLTSNFPTSYQLRNLIITRVTNNVE